MILCGNIIRITCSLLIRLRHKQNHEVYDQLEKDRTRMVGYLIMNNRIEERTKNQNQNQAATNQTNKPLYYHKQLRSKPT